MFTTLLVSQELIGLLNADAPTNIHCIFVIVLTSQLFTVQLKLVASQNILEAFETLLRSSASVAVTTIFSTWANCAPPSASLIVHH
jgi:hypothetical protein